MMVIMAAMLNENVFLYLACMPVRRQFMDMTFGQWKGIYFVNCSETHIISISLGIGYMHCMTTTLTQLLIDCIYIVPDTFFSLNFRLKV